MAKLKEKTFSTFGFEYSIQIEGFVLPLHFAGGLDTFKSKATTLNCLESEPSFILTPVT
jgi:hypothetical protein